MSADRDTTTFSFCRLSLGACAVLTVLVVLGSAGCQHSTDSTPSVSPATGTAAPAAAPRDSSPRTDAPPTPSPSTNNPVALPAYRVHEWAFSDFGMSVKTNFEVTLGEYVRWMEVSAVEPASSAQRAGLVVGDRLLALDRTEVTKLTREGLLAALFQRKKGDRLRALVMGRDDPLPHFDVLIANRP